MRNPRVRFTINGRTYSVSVPPDLLEWLEEGVGQGNPPWNDWREVAQSVGLVGLRVTRRELAKAQGGAR